MSEPKRIQRKRVKGWRMPENAVSVTRPGRWGNPYKVGARYRSPFNSEGFLVTTENCIPLFETYCNGLLALDPDHFAALRGKDLACWCKPGEPCHADVLLRLANAENGGQPK